MKKYLSLLMIIVILFTSCSSDNTPVYMEEDGIKFNARINEGNMQIFKQGKEENINIKSVNLKNYLPGQDKDSITKEQFTQWIEEIHNMNANTIKLDDLFPVEFYDSLYEYNKKSDSPIYLIQSIPMNTDNFVNNPDPFKLDNIVPFKDKIKVVISAIHGDISIPEKKGNIHGKYTSDISPYLLGWIVGNKWDPDIIDYTNNNRQDKKQYDGNYIVTEEARPFELFLADIMEFVIEYEMEEYNWQHPISFKNTVTTDIIQHPYEPNPKEDFVSINPNVIKTKNSKTNYFASYNVYPYYPDFLNLDPKYTKYIDHRGNTNNYSAYLNNLIKRHDMPVFISEFGVPSSRGLSRINTSNMNKGQHSEKEQGHIISNMYEDIIYQGGIGGSINSWQDEWNKSSWNMEGLDNPKRRNIWSNPQNSREQFGLISHEDNQILVDGDDKDWKKLKIEAFYKRDDENDKDNDIEKVFINHDNRYLYLAIQYDKLKDKNPNTLIFLDTLEGQGNDSNPFNPNIKTENKNEFVVHIGEHTDSKILVDSYYDVFYYKNSIENEFLEVNEEFNNKDNNIYNPIKSIINEAATNENTGMNIPFIDFETGRLVQGNGNPEDDDYNSLTDYSYNSDKNFLELRIPWALLNFTDPSTKEVIGDIHNNGLEKPVNIKGINIAVARFDSDDKISTHPKSKNNKISKSKIYTWENWNELELNQRLKDSYYIIQETFKNY